MSATVAGYGARSRGVDLQGSRRSSHGEAWAPGPLAPAPPIEGYRTTPEAKLLKLEQTLQLANDEAGLATLRKHRAALLAELRQGMTHCLSYYDGESDDGRLVTPADAVRLLDAVRSAEQEEAWALLVDGSRRVISRQLIHRGTVDRVALYLRDVFREAVRQNAAGLVLVHNHPSGEAWPSNQDDAITSRVRDSGNLLGIPLLDHVIIGAYGHYSYVNAGRVNPEAQAQADIEGDPFKGAVIIAGERPPGGT